MVQEYIHFGLFNDGITITRNYINKNESENGYHGGIYLDEGTDNANVTYNVVQDSKNWIDERKIVNTNQQTNQEQITSNTLLNINITNNHSNTTPPEDSPRIKAQTVNGANVTYNNNSVGESTWGNEAQEIISNSGVKSMFLVNTNYSAVDTTNNTRTVTITANREIQEVTGWTRSSDRKTLTKTYSENKTEVVTVKDLDDNQINITVKVTGIGENTGVSVSIRTNLAEDKTHCDVIITANKELQEVADWTLSTDKKSLTRTYYENGTYQVQVKPLSGSEITATFTVSGIEIENLQLSINKVVATNKKSCEVTITANKEIQGVTGWNLSTDKKKLTKTYTDNVTENVTVKDTTNNEETVSIVVNEIDKTKPELTVNVALATNKKSSEVTITANEEIQGVEGWTLSTDKKKLTKTYTDNVTENVIVKDLADNQETATVEVVGIIHEITSQNYIIENNLIRGISPNTRMEDFKNNVTSNQEYEVKENNESIGLNDIMKTGQTITIDEITYYIVVDGDSNGDGKADIEDINQLNAYRLNETTLQNISLIAGDINGDNTIDAKDLLRINKFRLGKISNIRQQENDNIEAVIRVTKSEPIIKPGTIFSLIISAECEEGINGLVTSYNFDTRYVELIGYNVNENFINLNEHPNSSVEIMNKEGSINSSELATLTFKVNESINEDMVTNINIGRILLDSDTYGKRITTELAIPLNITIGNTTPESNNIPENNTIPENNIIPGNNTIPENNVIPGNNTIPESNVIPGNNTIPENNVIPGNNTIPENNVIPGNNTIPENNVIPGNNMIPENNVIPSNNTIPDNNRIMENSINPENGSEQGKEVEYVEIIMKPNQEDKIIEGKEIVSAKKDDATTAKTAIPKTGFFNIPLLLITIATVGSITFLIRYKKLNKLFK